MRRAAFFLAAALGVCAAYVVAHWALIELGGEVIVLRTENPGGGWLESRLWIVDDGGVSWLHGADSGWMRNLEARPIVEVVRGGGTHRYRATVVRGPHPRIHEVLRAKYGSADRWVRFIGPDNEASAPVRLERLAPS
jgi:hypothetical protein